MSKSSIGVIGLAVMGQNIARNLARNTSVSVYNRTVETMREFVDQFSEEDLHGQETLEAFVESLEKPRRILIMVKAGKAIDAVIDALIPLLDKEDIVIDGGNAFYHNTVAREKKLAEKGIHFVGMGVSGGEKGALNGPSLMVGGSVHAWEHIRPMMESIAAKDFDGGRCVAHLGPDGAGHFVKMVHNGIEYAVMQMMAETYHIFRDMFGLSPEKIQPIFEHYASGPLKSFLFEISTWLLGKEDDLGKGSLLEKIMDKAGQKGTGRWTVTEAFEYGVAVPTISSAVEARIMSADRHHFELFQKSPVGLGSQGTTVEEMVPMVQNTLLGAITMAYLEGLWLIEKASQERGWDIDIAETLRIWQGGCIIQADLLKPLRDYYKDADNGVTGLFQHPHLREYLWNISADFLDTLSRTTLAKIPTPALSAARNHLSLLESPKGSAHFLQGLRDIFGAHTYERIDREGVFHGEWYDAP